MSRSLKSAQLPPMPQGGAVTWDALRTVLTQWQTLTLSAVDIRDETSEAAAVLTETIDPLPKVDEPAIIESPWTFDDLFAGTFVSTGAVSGGTVAATGAVSGATVAATGALTGATATVTGTVTAGNVALTAASTATTVGAAGAADALPANPVGYITISINGTLRKLPYYAV